jgi:hypothetical protein
MKVRAECDMAAGLIVTGGALPQRDQFAVWILDHDQTFFLAPWSEAAVFLFLIQAAPADGCSPKAPTFCQRSINTPFHKRRAFLRIVPETRSGFDLTA